MKLPIRKVLEIRAKDQFSLECEWLGDLDDVIVSTAKREVSPQNSVDIPTGLQTCKRVIVERYYQAR